MMPQKEVSEVIYQLADPDYGRYEGNHTSIITGARGAPRCHVRSVLCQQG